VNAPPPPPPPPQIDLDKLFLQEVRDAYFDFDKADIRPDARASLSATADFLKKYPSIKVTIEGHCDERGSTEYNLGLGDRRANAVKQYLVSLGISADASAPSASARRSLSDGAQRGLLAAESPWPFCEGQLTALPCSSR